MLNSSVLVLNRSFLPIHITSVRRAFSLLYGGGARAVDQSYQTFDFEGWMGEGHSATSERLGSTAGPVPIPRVILLTRFDGVPRRRIRFSRANVFARDHFICQYCAVQRPRWDLNLDHVVPRAQGGRTTWENVVCSCIACNRRKGGRTPDQAGLRLQRKPSRPRWSPVLSVTPAKLRYHEWRAFLIPSDRSGTSLDVAV